MSEIEALKAEIARLKAELVVPGGWICPECRVSQMTRIVPTIIGDVAFDLGEPGTCPDDGSTLRPLTWREHAAFMAAYIERKSRELGSFSCTYAINPRLIWHEEQGWMVAFTERAIRENDTLSYTYTIKPR